MCKMYRKLSVGGRWEESDIVLVNERVPATTRGDVSSCITSCPTRSLFRREKNLSARSYVHRHVYIHGYACFRSRALSPLFLFARRVGVKGFARPCLLYARMGIVHGKSLLARGVCHRRTDHSTRPRLAYAACIDGKSRYHWTVPRRMKCRFFFSFFAVDLSVRTFA